MYSVTFSADARYLHSFPTRRSSDLHFSPVLKLSPAEKLHHENPTGLHRNSAELLHQTDLFHCRRHRLLFQDRKSTRLNSSHRTISYAVFCLKKKNEENNNSTLNTNY